MQTNRIHPLIPWANLEIGGGITDAVAPATFAFGWDVPQTKSLGLKEIVTL